MSTGSPDAGAPDAGAPDLAAGLLGRLARVDTSSLVDAGGGALRVLPAALRPIRPGASTVRW